MTAPVLKGSGTVVEATALRLRGTQTDPYGEVLGGHKGLYDLSGFTDTYSNGGTVDNLILNQTDGVTTLAVTGVTTNKGIYKNTTSGVGVNLGSSFNLLNHGSEPSVVISVWATHKSNPSATNGIFGYAGNGSSSHQYGLLTAASGQVQMQVHGSSVIVAASLNAPTLYTYYIERTGSGVFQVRFYTGTTLASTATALTYPFRDPTVATPSAYPIFGYLHGYGGAYQGILHRANLIKVDPAVFDITSWLNTEYSTNSARFV